MNQMNMSKMYTFRDTMIHASHDTIIQVMLLIYTYVENSCLSSHNYIGDMTHIYMAGKTPIIILLSSGAVQSLSGPIVVPFGVVVCAAANSGPHRTMCRWIPVFITNSKSQYSQNLIGRVCVHVRCREPGAASHHV